MAPTLSNCEKCNKLFQKVARPICTACVQQEEDQFRVLYRALQKSAPQGGIVIEALAAEVGMPADEIERFYLEGRLSTAGTLLKFKCQACGLMMNDFQRKGRYCNTCSETTAAQAKVEVKSRQELEKGEEEARRRQEQISLLKQNQPATENAPRRYGMVRHRQ